MSTPTESPPASRRRRNIWLDADIEAALEQDADEHGRTISQSVRFHLRRALGMAA